MMNTESAYKIAILNLSGVLNALDTLMKAYKLTGEKVYYEIAYRIYTDCMKELGKYKFETLNGNNN